MPNIFLSVNSIWLVTSLSSLLVCSHSNRVLFLTPPFTVQVIVFLIIMFFFYDENQKSVKSIDQFLIIIIWPVFFDSSRHCGTGCFYGLSYVLSWRILSIVDSVTSCWRWLDSHKCLNSATIHASPVILVVLCIYQCRKYGDFSPTMVHYLKKSRIVANRILQRQNSRQRLDYILCHCTQSHWVQYITGMLTFNIIFSSDHRLIGSVLIMYVFAALASISHVLAPYRPTTILTTIAVRFSYPEISLDLSHILTLCRLLD